MNINVKQPYKLCDFKPTYGIVFSDYLIDFDFWGYCDLDIIFGQIRSFVTEEELCKYEVFSFRKQYPSGFFMLFKNTERINNLFRKSKDHKMILCSEEHYCFDECNFIHDYLMQGLNISEIEASVESMYHVITREIGQHALKASFKLWAGEGLPGEIEWRNGILTFKSRYQLLLFHLIDFKNNFYSRPYKGALKPESVFKINRYCITLGSPISLVYIYDEKLRPTILKGLHHMEYFVSRAFKRRFMKKEISGSYRYWNNDVVINEEGLISFKSTLSGTYKLFTSSFNAERLFLEGKLGVTLLLNYGHQNEVKGFRWIDSIGTTKNYKKLTDLRKLN